VARASRDLVEVTARELRDGDRDGHLMPGRRIVGAPQPISGGRVLITLQRANGRQETARPEAHRLFRVRRAVVGTGLPLRHRSKSRTTGRIVEVYDTHHTETTIYPEQAGGHRWAMRCEHGTIIGRRTLDLAIEDVSDPRLWCTRCVETMPGAKPLF